jgi:hypothetical protein
MKPRYFVFLFFLGLAANLVVAFFQRSPGYMDADYYYAGGTRLAQGYGFSEPFIWNYLDDPQGIPHPSHAYWMPLASILAAGGMLVSGAVSFSAARIGFLILAGLIPPIAAALAHSITQKRNSAILAGFLAVFSGFYLPFLPTTDTFGIYMLLGTLFFLALSPISSISSPFTPFLLGLLAGLLHLSRADGLLWLLIALIAAIYLHRRSPTTHHETRNTDYALRITPYALRNTSFVLLGYLMIMSPWILRNLSVFGTLLSAGGLRSLWLTNYDEIFSYPASILTFNHWINSGLKSILEARVWALGLNLQTVLAVQGEIFLFPLILLGLWHLRYDPRVRFGGLAWLGTFLVMTLVFPFAGARGGLFHSGAALQPLWWALAPVGLEVFLDWGGRKRGWRVGHARILFGWGLIGLALFVTLFVSFTRIFGYDFSNPVWNQTQAYYSKIDESLSDYGIGRNNLVLVNNPPGLYVTAHRKSISVPNGGIQTMLEVAKRYQARYLILESNHPQALNTIYEHPGDHPGLIYLFEVSSAYVYLVENIQ